MRIKPILIIAVILLTFFAAQKILAATYYVGTAGTPGGNYFTDIQSAVDTASAGDLVLVSNGVYNSGERITPGYSLLNRVVMTKNIILQSVSGAENTIILGAKASGGGNGDGAVRCVFMTEGTVSGFTISNGFTLTSGLFNYNRSGGGIWITNGCVVTNCIINKSSADFFGGGVYCQNGGEIYGCTINGNSATNGGGVHCFSGGVVSDCTINGNRAIDTGGGMYSWKGEIFDCTISGNVAGNKGGGTYFHYYGTVSNCLISGNVLENNFSSGGGVYCKNGGVISDCVISNNSAKSAGGGVVCYKGGVISNCIINGNSLGDFGDGGGVCCESGGSVYGCTINGNSAGLSGGTGGGVTCWGGGIISDCTISGNSAKSGGGVKCHDGGSVSKCAISSNSAEYGGGANSYNGGAVSECTISGNSASQSGGGVYCSKGGTFTNCLISGMNTAPSGGGVMLWDDSKIINCTIVGNSATYKGGGIFCANDGTIINTIIYDNQAASGDLNWRLQYSGMDFSYCCTIPISGLPGGIGCFSENPMFVSPGSDYHLKEGSSCIDAGLNMPWMIGATDLDGNPRIYNGTVNIGAYEYLSGKIRVTSPDWKLKNNKKKGLLKGKPITPLLMSYLTNGYGIGIWNLDTDSNVDGPRKLTAKNKKGTVWIFKDKNDKTAKITYSEKYNVKKDIYKTKLKYILQGGIPESNQVYIAPLE